MEKFIRLNCFEDISEDRRNELIEKIMKYQKEVGWPKKCGKCEYDLCKKCEEALLEFLKEYPRSIVSLLEGQSGLTTKVYDQDEVTQFITAMGTLPPLYYHPKNMRETKRIAKSVLDLVRMVPPKHRAVKNNKDWSYRSEITDVVFDLLNIPVLDDVSNIGACLARAGFEQIHYAENLQYLPIFITGMASGPFCRVLAYNQDFGTRHFSASSSIVNKFLSIKALLN
jgi:hypothetical protein